ncbi:MAG TPA: phosphate/phosphite/phosphonate ABC transporter substrate-binding protein [Verrucomicrobiae bacterium]|jgi:phosphonate transport system substrate-binding protein|nr:phosphate/phosphite/phosphonate ABC transporter substrate-binding protein [Verrucomicrobiae bacterium]
MKRLTFFLPVLIALIAAAPPAQSAARDAKTIALGFVSEKPPEEVEAHLKDFAVYVGKKLNLEGKVITAPTVSQLAKDIEQRRVDFYMDSPYPTYLINRQGTAMLLLRRWKSGMAEYRSIVFAKKDGPVKKLDDLKGKLIAFEDPGSTSAYFLPKVFLMKKGMRLTEKAGPLSPVAAKETGYIFTYSIATTVDLVLSGKAGGGAFSNDDFARIGDRQAQIVKLAETAPFPRNLVSVRKDLDPALVKRLKEVLLAMDKDEEGKKVLAKTDETNKFDPLPGGEEAMRRQLQELFRGRD